AAEHIGEAPPLDGPGDDGEGPAVGAFRMGGVLLQGVADLLGVMAVDLPDDEAGGAQLGCGDLRPLLPADHVRLPVAVAVEDGADGGDAVVDEEIDGLTDLPLAAL